MYTVYVYIYMYSVYNKYNKKLHLSNNCIILY